MNMESKYIYSLYFQPAEKEGQQLLYALDLAELHTLLVFLPVMPLVLALEKFGLVLV